MQGLVFALQTIANQSTNRRQSDEILFGTFMAKIKFRTNIAEVSEEKSFDAYIDSGANHHFSTAGPCSWIIQS